MKSFFSSIGMIVLVGALAVGLFYGANELNLYWMRTYGTQIESANTNIYRENKSYVEGTVRDLRNLRADYEQATPSQQEALRSLILHRANELDWDHLPSDVRSFLSDLEN